MIWRIQRKGRECGAFLPWLPTCALLLGLLSCVGGDPKLDAGVSNQAAAGNLAPLQDLVARDSTALYRRDPITNRTALHFAAYWGHENFTKELLDAGAEPDSKDVDQHTPLHWASERGHLGVVDLLLDAGANINAQSKDGETALHRAVFWGRLAVIDGLLERGADPNIHGFLGWTPLHVASSVSPSSLRRLLGARELH